MIKIIVIICLLNLAVYGQEKAALTTEKSKPSSEATKATTTPTKATTRPKTTTRPTKATTRPTKATTRPTTPTTIPTTPTTRPTKATTQPTKATKPSTNGTKPPNGTNPLKGTQPPEGTQPPKGTGELPKMTQKSETVAFKGQQLCYIPRRASLSCQLTCNCRNYVFTCFEEDCFYCQSEYRDTRNCTQSRENNLASGAVATQTSTQGDEEASFAVDGDRIDSCSETTANYTKPNKLSVDLGNDTMVSAINIYIKPGTEDTWKIHVRVSRTPTLDQTTCARHNISFNPIRFMCSQPLKARYISVTNDPPGMLSICEVEVFKCSQYHYGDECMRYCNCKNEFDVCDQVTGVCPSEFQHSTGKTSLSPRTTTEQIEFQHYSTNCSEGRSVKNCSEDTCKKRSRFDESPAAITLAILGGLAVILTGSVLIARILNHCTTSQRSKKK